MSYTYDLSGNMLTKTDRNGAVTTCTYDGMNRLLTSMVLRNAVQTGSTSITYAKTGAKASESNANVTKNYTYDSLGRMINETETGGIVKTYGYDIGDNRTSMKPFVSGVQQMEIGYTYDSAGRLLAVREDGELRATYSYDANGNRLSLTYPNGNTTLYTYNIGNMVTRLENKQGSTILSAYDYAYYLDGDQRSKADNTGKVTTYVYDSLGRLKSEVESGTTSSSISYTYDLSSNRSTMTVDSTDDYVVYYWYDANNRLLFTAKAQGTANTGTAYFYDGNGNTISTKEAALSSSNYATEMAAMRASVPTAATTGVTLYGYDGYNRQTSVSSSATTSTYTYNPDGLRRSKTVDGVVTRHIWDGQNIVAELDGNGAVTNRFIRGINLIAGKNSASVLTYYLFNAHGDVVGLTNTSGAVTKSYDYDAFGNEKSIVSTDANPFRYCGEYLDLSSGTYYLRARYYDPTIGRFLSEDTYTGKTTDPLSLNLYTYCKNNPIRYIDPTGHAVTDWDRAVLPLSYIEALEEYTKKWDSATDEMKARYHHDAERMRSEWRNKDGSEYTDAWGITRSTETHAEIKFYYNDNVLGTRTESPLTFKIGYSISNKNEVVLALGRQMARYANLSIGSVWRVTTQSFTTDGTNVYYIVEYKATTTYTVPIIDAEWSYDTDDGKTSGTIFRINFK